MAIDRGPWHCATQRRPGPRADTVGSCGLMVRQGSSPAESETSPQTLAEPFGLLRSYCPLDAKGLARLR